MDNQNIGLIVFALIVSMIATSFGVDVYFTMCVPLRAAIIQYADEDKFEYYLYLLSFGYFVRYLQNDPLGFSGRSAWWQNMRLLHIIANLLAAYDKKNRKAILYADLLIGVCGKLYLSDLTTPNLAK